jgi:hypothetical protein
LRVLEEIDADIIALQKWSTTVRLNSQPGVLPGPEVGVRTASSDTN